MDLLQAISALSNIASELSHEQVIEMKKAFEQIDGAMGNLGKIHAVICHDDNCKHLNDLGQYVESIKAHIKEGMEQ